MKFQSGKKKSAVGARRRTSAKPVDTAQTERAQVAGKKSASGAKKQKNEKRRKRLSAVTIAMICACGAVFLFSCYKLLGILLEYRKGADEYKTITEIAVKLPESDEANKSPYLDLDFDALREINSDLVGWIEIPDTGISYPIVQGVDNAYYLRRSFEGQSYLGGVIFLDYLAKADYSGVNTIIYGHHMMDGSMFAPIAKFIKQDYLDAHPRVYIYTEHSILVYRIFTAYQTDIADSCYTGTFADDISSDAWLRAMFERAKTADSPTGDRVITLSTCTNVEKTGRYIVQAVHEETIVR